MVNDLALGVERAAARAWKAAKQATPPDHAAAADAAGAWELAVQLRFPTIAGQLRYWLLAIERDDDVPTSIELTEPSITVFVSRASERGYLGCGPTTDCLMIAGVYLSEELRGRGWFKSFLMLCVDVNPWPRLLVQTVINQRLEAFCHRLGFEVVDLDVEGPSFLIDAATVRNLGARSL